MEIADFICGRINQAYIKLRERANLIKEDARDLRKATKEQGMIFKIFIRSFWADQGGKHVYYQNRKPAQLDEVVKKAVQKARKFNGRESISLDKGFSVSVILPSGYKVDLPERFWLESAIKWAKKYEKRMLLAGVEVE